MQIQVEDVSSVKKILHIEVPAEDVVREIDKAYSDLKKTVKVKGFRPGKVPRSVLERHYRKEVNADVRSRIVQASFVDALRQTELKMVGEPKIEPPELSTGDSYRYDATVEISPDIADIDYKGLQLKKTRYEISEGEIQAQLKMLQRNLAQKKPLGTDRPLQEGDFALIDYEGFQNDAPFQAAQKTENFTLKIGDGHIHEDLDAKMVGMKREETREIEVTFAEDYFNKDLAGQTVNFQVRLNDIMEEELPSIDDDMAKALGRFESLEEVKNTIRQNLAQGYEKRVEQELNEQVFKELIAKADFEVPEVLIEYELQSILEEAERAFAYRNISMEEKGLSRESLAEKYRPTAEKQVRRYLILNKIIGQENMSLSDEDLENGYSEMAQTVNQPVEQIKSYYQQNPDKLDYFKHALLEKQATKLILDSSNIQEVEPELLSGDEQQDS